MEHPEVSSLDKRIYTEEEKYRKMERAIKLGADKAIMQDPMDELQQISA